MMQQQQIDAIIEAVRSGSPQSCMVGFDGFVDEIIDVVRTRQDADSYERMEQMTELSDRIARAAGLSGGIEMVCRQTKLGGNGPIMAQALLAHGHPLHYIGALGKEQVHPVFADFAQRCTSLISVADPGITEALEFSDGKMMLSRVAPMNEVNWVSLLRHLPVQQLEPMVRQAALIGFTNWSSLLRMNSLIEGVMNILDECPQRPWIFFDLADPRKRTSEDICEVLQMMTAMQNAAEVIFGMNRNESDLIAQVLEIEVADTKQRAAAIRQKLQLAQVVIHPLEGAAVATAEGSWWVDGPYTAHPRLTTGAGDNFNAGYCHGILCGLKPWEALFCGVSTSGFYVRQMHSPDTAELAAFMQVWPADAR
jgi:sugar/nucleoside kinase (ribokinase family)